MEDQSTLAGGSSSSTTPAQGTEMPPTPVMRVPRAYRRRSAKAKASDTSSSSSSKALVGLLITKVHHTQQAFLQSCLCDVQAMSSLTAIVAVVQSASFCHEPTGSLPVGMQIIIGNPLPS